MTAFVLLSLTAPRPTQHISKTALSQSLFVLQSSVCLYGLAFALSHSLFVGRMSVCLYGFAFALSTPLRIFLQFITTAHKPQTPHLPYKRFAGFTKCSKSPSPLPPLEKGEVACRQMKNLKIRLYYAIYQMLAYLQLFCLQDGGD